MRSRLEHLSTNDVGWKALSGIVGSFTKFLTIASQVSVLIAVFNNEKGGREFAVLALIQPLVLLLNGHDEGPMPVGGGQFFHARQKASKLEIWGTNDIRFRFPSVYSFPPFERFGFLLALSLPSLRGLPG